MARTKRIYGVMVKDVDGKEMIINTYQDINKAVREANCWEHNVHLINPDNLSHFFPVKWDGKEWNIIE